MKIGILTYHRAENYGALLQAYALRTYLQSLGHEVSFVDYWPQYHADFFKVFSWDRFKHATWKGKIRNLLESTIWLAPRITRSKRFKRFIYYNNGLGKKSLYNEKTIKTAHYDVVVYGSDQIWRKQNICGVGFDDWYFGADNVQADNKIVYAGSMGNIKTIDKDDEYVRHMMQNFKNISVRETDLQNYLQKLQVPSTLVIDPVFLLSEEQWQEIALPKRDNQEKYIVFYNLLNRDESERFTENLSREMGLPIIELNKKMSFCHHGKRYISNASIPEFLRLIRDAEYVVSNSFHGVAFSLIFRKQFFAVGMGEKANRVRSLLFCAGISERYVADISFSPLRMDSIDYHKVFNKLQTFIEISKGYLTKSLGK